MTQKILLPVPVTLDLDRAKALLERIRRRVSEGKVNSHDELLGEATAAMDTFFSNLSEPLTPIDGLGAERDPSKHNDIMNSVRGDLDAGFNTARALGASIVSSFNLTASLVSSLDGKIRKLATKSQDLQSTSGVVIEEVIVAGDNFSDSSKIDLSKVAEEDRGDIVPGMGATLRRVEAATVTDGADLTVQSNYPIYEGKYFALEGEAIPEGGKFHFKKTGEVSVLGQPITITVPLSGTEIPIPGSARETSVTVPIADTGASDEEKKINRANILDGSPDSFWQAEHVIDLPDLNISEITYQDLVKTVSGGGIDRIDLEVTLTLKMAAPSIVNMLVLDPLNAGDGAWLEVTDISTSLEGSDWKQIQGFADHNYENILTDEANEELTDHEVGMTLAANKYEYTGKGLWTFPAVEARYIRVTLLQRAPVPAPYDVKILEMQGSTTTTHVGGGSSPTYVSTSVETRKEELSYDDTLMTLNGIDKTTKILGGAGTSGTEKDIPLFGGSPYDAVQDFFDPGRFLHSPAKRSTTREFSGWTLKDTWMETRWDKARYMIGIRDLRAFSYIFSGSSEVVTKAFRSPKPITKITLHTDEAVPSEFNDEPILQPWILYWISLDDGTTWLPICPSSPGVINRLQGSTLPITININSHIPAEEWEPTQTYIDVEEPRSVRLKWRLVRPSTYNDRTPVLKSYQLKLFVEGGL